MLDGGKIQHGWLGIDLEKSPAGQSLGAVVTAVDPKGPSATHLQGGDVIEAIDGRPVHSMADLAVSACYFLAPGRGSAAGGTPRRGPRVGLWLTRRRSGPRRPRRRAEVHSIAVTSSACARCRS